MSSTNTTRISLVCRLRDHDDAEAWSRFVDIYGPLIYRYGRRRGLQDADASDLAQDVLREVSSCIERFEYDPTAGRFRNWLLLIARRTLSRRIRSQRNKPRATGNSGVLEQLHSLPNREEEDAWEKEYRQHVFQQASQQMADEFTEKTWAAFWQTAVEGQRPADVASALGMQVGSVYVAKNRIMKRLREKVQRIDETLDF